MGAEASKDDKAVRKPYFSQQEEQALMQALKKLGKDNTNTILVSELKKHLATSFNENIASRIIDILINKNGKNSAKESKQNADKSTLLCSDIIHKLGPFLKGDSECQVSFMVILAGGGKDGISSEAMLEFTSEVLKSYLKVADAQSKTRHWVLNSEDCLRIAKATLNDLLYGGCSYKEIWGEPIPSLMVTYEALEKWYRGNSVFSMILEETLKSCFPYITFNPNVHMPQSKDLPKELPGLLSSAEVLFLNSALPSSLQSEWRFLFSTTKHAWSFSIFMKQIVGKGPTLIVMEDQSGNKFGGFASVSWEVRPQFHGTAECFLFSLSPRGGIFYATNFNKNFMYLNYLEKNTMPNGLGMGGREELFGFWLDYDFGKGKVAPTCSTFRNPPLSPNEEIDIRSMEVWALGPEEVDSDDDELKNTSALDKNQDAKALLDMVGREQCSEGLR